MAHEITTTDNVLLHTERAWHNLGIVINEDLTPKEALTRCGIDWGVKQEPLFRYVTHHETGTAELMEVESHVMNVRADNEAQLGIVGKGYQPIQNIDLAEFSEALASQETGVVVETCGTIRGGRKVWFLCRADSFTIGKTDDEVVPYLLISNGHDGTASLRVTPTTVRVVCSNTLHAVIPSNDGEGSRMVVPGLAFTHTLNIHERVEEAKRALGMLHSSIHGFRFVADNLAQRHIRQSQLETFFTECYERDFNEIPDGEDQDKKSSRRRQKAKDAFNLFSQRFDDDIQLSGASWWTAVNAYTGLIQHDMKGRGKDDAARIESRVASNLLGLNSRRSKNALETAFQLAQ